MHAVVEQALREVHGGDAEFAFLCGQRHDELVTGAPVRVGDVETRVPQPGGQVVGVQRRELAHAAHAVAAEHQGIGQSAQENARVAHEGGQPTDGLRGLCPSIAAWRLLDERPWQVGCQHLPGSHRPRAGAATTVGRGKGLVQVQVQDVETHVSRLHFPQDRIQVRAVVVQQAAGVVNDGGDFLDSPFE